MAQKKTKLPFDIRKVIKFDCDACADAFPKGCRKHRRHLKKLAAPQVAPRTRAATVLVHPAVAVARQRQEDDELRVYDRSSSKPSPGYTAPYEHLETEIRAALAGR